MRLLRARIVRVNVSIAFGLLSVLIIVAPTLIPWLYGARWEPAVVPAQILAVSGMALTVMSGTEQLILAVGRPRLLLALNGTFLLAIAVAVLIASSHGLTAACIAVTAVHIVMVAIAQVGVLRRLIGLQLRQLAADLAPATVSAAFALALGFAAATATGGLAAPLEIAALAAVTAGTYLIVYRVLFGPDWAELRGTFGRVLRPKAQADEPMGAVPHGTALEEGLDELAGPEPFA